MSIAIVSVDLSRRRCPVRELLLTGLTRSYACGAAVKKEIPTKSDKSSMP